MNSTITEMKNKLEGINSRITEEEEQISSLKTEWWTSSPQNRIKKKDNSNQSILVLAQNRNTDQWNCIESLEINPYSYGQFMTKEARIYDGEKTISSINGAGKTGQQHIKE